MHFWRGFFVYAAVSIGLPILLVVLSLSGGGMAMLFAYTIAPVLIFAFPVLLLSASGTAPFWVSLYIAIVCCAVFGFLARRRTAGAQWLLALVTFAGWWIGWWLICLVKGVHPHFDVRM